MRRREFMVIGGGAVLASRLPAQAQVAERIPRVGWIILGSPAGGFADIFSYYDSFRAGLVDLGYVEGKNINLIARSALGVPEALPGLVDELVREKSRLSFRQGRRSGLFGRRSNRSRSCSPLAAIRLLQDLSIRWRMARKT